jgi:hypothetical protein
LTFNLLLDFADNIRESVLEGNADISMALLQEMRQWYMNLGPEGAPKMAFTGVTADGDQSVSNLSQLPLENRDILPFLAWLCRAERLIAYAYVTHLVAMTESGSAKEQFGFYASSSLSKSTTWLDYIEGADGGGHFEPQRVHSDQTSDIPFHNLDSANTPITQQDESRYAAIWVVLRTRSMWRKRESN